MAEDFKVRATVEEAIEEIKKGNMIILVDDEDRENEGDLVIAAQFANQENINFMAKEGRGLICLTMTGERCDQLKLKQMRDDADNKSRFGTAFTYSIEAKEGISTGISASDRAKTVLTAIDPNKGADDIVTPGHMFPIRAKVGGVLIRAGQTEGSVDLAKMAGLNPSGVICEIMNEDGTMARMPQLEVFAKKHKLKILTIADMISYRLEKDPIVEQVSEALLPTTHGDFKIIGFRNYVDGQESIALVMGDITTDEPVLTRIHSSCLTGDVFGSLRCDCGDQLHKAMEMVKAEGRGVILYLFQEGRGIGIMNKIKAYKLQDQGLDTVEANIRLGFQGDLREYGFGAQTLKKLGIKKMRLMTNNPLKIKGLSGYGLEVVERVALMPESNDKNRQYLCDKQEKMGHLLNIIDKKK